MAVPLFLNPVVEQPTRGTVNGLGDLGDGVLAFAVPLALTVICWLGSPRSTALATWAMERTWAVRLDRSYGQFGR